MTPYDPNSPYSASKAGADHLVRSYFATYGLPVLITNCSNNYGPYQFPEKLIPLMILNALEGNELPIYGDGANVRDWLFVGGPLRWHPPGSGGRAPGREVQHRRGQRAHESGAGGPALRPPGPDASRSVESRHVRRRGRELWSSLKTFVPDRPGHDRRYAIDSTKIRNELGWRPAHDLDSGLAVTVRWYLEHRDWCEAVQSGTYRRERLGLGSEGRPG